jgi:plasmid maintenance system antidote protein VapI
MKQRVIDSEKVYISSMKGMRTNLRISSEIGYSIKKLLDSSTAIFSAFQNIQDQAEEHKKDMLEQEKVNRNLLRIEKK